MALCYRTHKIGSSELFKNKMNNIKLLLNKNCYPEEFIKRTKTTNLKTLKCNKAFRRENLVVSLKIP